MSVEPTILHDRLKKIIAMSGPGTHRVAKVMALILASLIGTRVSPQATQRVIAQSYEKARKSLQDLQGKWSTRDGIPVAGALGNRLIFSVKRFQIRRDGELLSEGTFVLESDVEPPTINFHHTSGALKGKTWKGIYSLDGGELKLCYNGRNLEKPRPAEFKTNRDSGYELIALSQLIP